MEGMNGRAVFGLYGIPVLVFAIIVSSCGGPNADLDTVTSVHFDRSSVDLGRDGSAALVLMLRPSTSKDAVERIDWSTDKDGFIGYEPASAEFDSDGKVAVNVRPLDNLDGKDAKDVALMAKVRIKGDGRSFFALCRVHLHD